MSYIKRIYVLIGASAFALIGLVLLQLHWIKEGVQLKEAQFDHRVNLALRDVGREMRTSAERIQRVTRFLERKKMAMPVDLESPSYAFMDSLLASNFHYQNINLKYKFYLVYREKEEELPPNDESLLSFEWQQTPYRGCMDRVLQTQGWDLRICFPNKERYLLTEMASLLILSVGFVFMILASLIITVTSLLRQKKLTEMTRDFINNMTHEFKTPIATIRLASTILQREKVQQYPDKIVKYAKTIERESTKLTDHVEHILQIARLEKGEIQLEKNPISLHEIITDAVEVIGLQVKSREGILSVDFGATQDQLCGDSLHLRNIFLNLLDNANKYSKEAPQIHVQTKNVDKGIEISIKDQGIGMSKEKQQQAFDKFYRVNTGDLHDVKGFGLGLAYVKMMTEAHEGKVRLQSKLGEGSTFTVFLPLSCC